MKPSFECEQVFPPNNPEVDPDRLGEVIDYAAEDVEAVFEDRFNQLIPRSSAAGSTDGVYWMNVKTCL